MGNFLSAILRRLIRGDAPPPPPPPPPTTATPEDKQGSDQPDHTVRKYSIAEMIEISRRTNPNSTHFRSVIQKVDPVLLVPRGRGGTVNSGLPSVFRGRSSAYRGVILQGTPKRMEKVGSVDGSMTESLLSRSEKPWRAPSLIGKISDLARPQNTNSKGEGQGQSSGDSHSVTETDPKAPNDAVELSSNGNMPPAVPDAPENTPENSHETVNPEEDTEAGEEGRQN